jgi:TetR/AcrR family transcriptional repressor of nem operon
MMTIATGTKDRLLEAAEALLWEEGLAAASVDALCEKAQVHKGSFYHYFKSKSDLVIAALDAHFESARKGLERVFFPGFPPVERLRGFFDLILTQQAHKRQESGRVLGCALASIGGSCSSLEERIREHVEKIMSAFKGYLESAFRDGQADRSIPVSDVAATVETVFDCIEGALTAARIKNSLLPVANLGPGVFKLLGLEWKARPPAAGAPAKIFYPDQILPTGQLEGGNKP